MIRRMQEAQLERPEVVVDGELHQEKIGWSEVATIRVAISETSGSQSLSNDVLGINATHIGVTYWQDVMAGDRLRAGDRVYKVDYVREGRLMQLMLEEVRAVG